jgi:glycosyltransferase involved in cell wall biosynthesis
MTIHFYTFSDRTQPSSRQRTFYTAESLQKRGYDVVIHMPTVLSLSTTPWPKKLTLLMQFVRTLSTIKKDDIVYLQRTAYNKYFVSIMALYLVVFRRKSIFDYDDPIYVHSAFKVWLFCKIADAVIVSTHRQLEWGRQYNDNVHYIHFAIDPSPYEEMSKDYSYVSDKPVIGWLGTGPEHLHNLPLLVEPFKRLVAAGASFKFLLIGSFNNSSVHALFEDIPGLYVQFVDRIPYTDPYSAPNVVRTFDIGVVPHQMEGEWNMGKTSMKVLEYMACGVPSVVSAFGEMPYIITDGVDGFFAKNSEEWVDKLTLLLNDPVLRERLGLSGQRRVRAGGFDLETAVSKVAHVIDFLHAKR